MWLWNINPQKVLIILQGVKTSHYSILSSETLQSCLSVNNPNQVFKHYSETLERHYSVGLKDCLLIMVVETLEGEH